MTTDTRLGFDRFRLRASTVEADTYEVKLWVHGKPEAQAARDLANAAPDLLAALEALLEDTQYSYERDMHNLSCTEDMTNETANRLTAEAAIARAKGAVS